MLLECVDSVGNNLFPDLFLTRARMKFKLLSDFSKTNTNHQELYIPTLSPNLNSLLNDKGFTLGNVFEIAGIQGIGKTQLA